MTGRDGEAGFRSDMQVEQLGDARHDDLDADAEGEEWRRAASYQNL